MLRFITSPTTPIASQLINAHLIVRDNQIVPGKIELKDNVIETQAQGHTNFSLCLLYDAGKAGRLMLQTPILPSRPEPYILALELARYRIKLFLDKCEEWNMFDLSSDHPATLKWEKAREIFTTALVSPEKEDAIELARQALHNSIDANERLALAHADFLLHRRYTTKCASSSTLGVRIDSSRFDKPLRDLVEANVDLVSIPIPWSEIESEQGCHNWSATDRWVKWARDNSKNIIAGPLLDFSKEDAIPQWVRAWEHDFSEFRDRCYDHVERVIRRYGGAISFWNVASGINTNAFVRLSVPNMVDLIRTASLVVRQTRKGARVMIELSDPFSEFVGKDPDSASIQVFWSRLQQEGINLDALGVQVLGGQCDGRATRDLMDYSSLLDRFFLYEIPLIVSALGVPCEIIDERGGWWKSPWTDEIQQQWAHKMLLIALSKPHVESIIWTDLFDHKNSQLPKAALIS
ncbi:MAG: endo-1,4-beta-xylanase, partial [Phycisphaerales bacterium]|nr:endo-1,4-beta-xylanase [Phycisphaerales bacterium]